MDDERDESVPVRIVARNVMSMPIDKLDLTVRSYNCLRRAGITSVGALVRKTPAELMSIKGMGITSVRDVERALAELDLRIAMTPESVSVFGEVDGARDTGNLDAFIDVMQVLCRSGITGASEITGMTPDGLLAVPGMDPDRLTVLERGVQRWGLRLGQNVQDGQPAKPSTQEQRGDVPETVDGGSEGNSVCFDRAATVKEKLVYAVNRLLAGIKGVSSECFVAYHGMDGDPPRTLQEIGDEGDTYGFERSVTRERVRQVLQRTEWKLNSSARRAQFLGWDRVVEEVRHHLPESVHSFVLRFGYKSAMDPERVFDMLKLCADLFELDFPFGQHEFDGITMLVSTPVDDNIMGLDSRLRKVADRPFAEFANVADQLGCDREWLRRVISESGRWEFLDDECSYFWKRPRLPPQNYSITGNAILTSLCKVFSVTKCATTSDLARSVVRDRILRKDGLLSQLPVQVLEGIAENSGLFDVNDGQISRRSGLDWCVIGRRDAALLRICVDQGRVVPSHVITANLLRAGLTRENSAIVLAYSPFLVHTRSGVGFKEGVYKFVVQAKDIDLQVLDERIRDNRDDRVEEAGDVCIDDGRPASEAHLKIAVSSRTKLSGRFFAQEALGLDGKWDVRDAGGADIGQIIISGRTVSGLGRVIAVLGLEKGEVLEMRPGEDGTLVAGQ